MEDEIREHLIPALFQTTPDKVLEDMRVILTHRVKQGGMNIHNPMVEACVTLVTSLAEDSRLDAQCHTQCVYQASTTVRKARVDDEMGTVEVVVMADCLTAK